MAPDETPPKETELIQRREYSESRFLDDVVAEIGRKERGLFDEVLPQGAELRYKREWDEDGELVLGLWVILSDGSPESEDLDAQDRIEERILSIAEKNPEVPPPQVRFRLKSEQTALETEDAAA